MGICAGRVGGAAASGDNDLAQVLAADRLPLDRAGVDLDARLDVAADLEGAEGLADVDDESVLDTTVDDRALDVEGLEVAGDADVGAEVAAHKDLGDVSVDAEGV